MPSRSLRFLSTIAVAATLAICNSFSTARAAVSLGRSVAAPVAQDAGISAGVAWGDYDNDGWPDLYFANWGNQDNFLYHNNGDGTFTRIADVPPTQAGGSSSGACWGDYDNDGDLDLFVANQQNEHNQLFRNDGSGAFTRITTGDIVTDYGDSYSAAWADYDNDGWLDLYVANVGQPNFLYHNNGDGTFRAITDSPISNFPGSTRGVAWADYDNDGWVDLFVPERGSGPNYLFHNDRGKGFTRITDGPLGTDSALSNGGEWGDFDNDGQLDLFVVNGDFLLNPQHNFLYRNLGDGHFERIIHSPVVRDSSAAISSCWADFDHDGDLDLYVTIYAQDDRIYENNGDGTFTEIETGIAVNFGGFTTGIGAADFDFDGDIDLMLANWENQNNGIVLGRAATGNWLEVECRRVNTNRFGIGAVLQAVWREAGQRFTAARQITTHVGFRSQPEPMAHFGLGSAEQVDSLVIIWPGGNTEVLSAIGAGQRITVTEGSGITNRRRPEVHTGLPSAAPIAQKAISESGIERGLAVLDSLSTHHADTYNCSEAVIVGLGYQLLFAGQPSEARAVFLFTAERHPGSANAWDCVAEACAALDDIPGVVEYTRKVLEVIDTDPNISPQLRETVRNAAGYRLKHYGQN